MSRPFSLPNAAAPETPSSAIYTRLLARDTSRYALASLLPALTSVAGVSVFTRLFDAASYGQYALVVATTSICTVLLSGWVQQSVLRYYPRFREEGRASEFVSKLSAWLAVLAVAVIAVSPALVLPLARSRPDYEPYLWPAVLLLVAEAAFQGLTSVYQADLRSAWYAAAKIAVSLLRFGAALAVVLLVFRHASGLVIGGAVANALLVVPLARGLALWKGARPRLGSLDFGFLRMIASYGVPMVGWMLGGQILSISDRFVIGAFHGSGDVGIYSANYNLVAMGAGLASAPVLMAAHPLIMGAWERGDRQAVPVVVSTFSRYYAILVVPALVFVTVFSREIAELFLGSGFRAGHAVMPIVLLGIAIWGLAMYGHKGLELMERTRTMLGLVAVCAAANVVLNLAVVPRYGYMGAAVTTLACYALYPVLVHRATKRHLPWSIPWRSLGRIVAAAVPMALVSGAVVLVALPPYVTLVVGGLAGSAAYIFFLRILGGLDVADVRRLLTRG